MQYSRGSRRIIHGPIISNLTTEENKTAPILMSVLGKTSPINSRDVHVPHSTNGAAIEHKKKATQERSLVFLLLFSCSAPFSSSIFMSSYKLQPFTILAGPG